MKYILFFIVLFTSSSVFAAPATKDDIKMLIQQMDKRFEDVNRRFEDMNSRFEDMNKRFEMMQHQMDKRFEDMQRYMDKRLESLTNILIFCFSVLAASMGFLYHRQSSITQSIGSLESTVQAILERIERIEASIQAILERSQPNFNQSPTYRENNDELENIILKLQNADEQTKRKFREVLEVH